MSDATNSTQAVRFNPDPPRAVRPEGQDHLFRKPNSNPKITPDRVGPVVESYFHLPPVWIGEAPLEESIAALNPGIHHALAFSRTLTCGVRVRANRDGMFSFDFTNYGPVRPVLLPGFIAPEDSGSYRYTVEHDEADRRAEATAVTRAQILNAHQSCMVTAQWLTNRSSGGAGFPVTSWSSYKALALGAPPPYWDDLESLHGLAHNVSNRKYHSPEPQRISRRVVSLDVVSRSFDLLDQLLLDEALVGLRLVEAAFMVSTRKREKRYGEAITLGWTICEQLVSIAWRRHLEEIKAQHPERMTKDRRGKLLGRDFTASVRNELLEMSGKLSHDVFRLLEIARKARNNWAHEMTEPREREVWACTKAIEQLMGSILGIPLYMWGGGRGGVPQWPVWFWSEFDPDKI